MLSCYLIDGCYLPTYSGYDVDIRTHFIIIQGENKIKRRYVQRETCTKVQVTLAYTSMLEKCIPSTLINNA